MRQWCWQIFEFLVGSQSILRRLTPRQQQNQYDNNHESAFFVCVYTPNKNALSLADENENPIDDISFHYVPRRKRGAKRS